TISAETDRSALLVMSEVAFPGWRADVDGCETELLRVNYLLRAVQLLPGKHTIKLYYQPRSFVSGAIVSLLSIPSLLLLLIRDALRRCRNKSVEQVLACSTLPAGERNDG